MVARIHHLLILGLLCPELVLPDNSAIAEQFHRIVDRRAADMIGPALHFLIKCVYVEMVVVGEHHVEYGETLRSLSQLVARQIFRQFGSRYQYCSIFCCHRCNRKVPNKDNTKLIILQYAGYGLTAAISFPPHETAGIGCNLPAKPLSLPTQAIKPRPRETTK